MNQTPPNLARLFDGAEPRPRPTQEERSAAFQRVQMHWRQTVAVRARNRQRRFALGGLLAASLVVTVGLFLRQPAPTAPVPVATIERIHGDVLVRTSASSVWRPLTRGAFSLVDGTRLRTLNGALRVRTHNGGSVRIDSATVVSFLADANLSLETGRVYFDSGASNAHVNITTPLGTIRNLGTQFSVRLDDETLAIAMRSGTTVLTGKGSGDATTHSGQRRVMFMNGAAAQVETIDDTAGEWAWADALSGEFLLDGQTAEKYLEWVTRETGLTYRFASDHAQDTARREVISASRSFDASMRDVKLALRTVDLLVLENNGELVISRSR